MSIRPIRRLVKAKPTMEGAGVHLRRAHKEGKQPRNHKREENDRGGQKYGRMQQVGAEVVDPLPSQRGSEQYECED